MTEQLCDECEREFTKNEWDHRHTHHEDSCPNENEWDDGIHHVDCDCDVNYHDRCCPICNLLTRGIIWQSQEVLQRLIGAI